LKLYYSATSPYVGKVIACAVACGTLDQITRIDTNPHVSPPDLLADNPLSKGSSGNIRIGLRAIVWFPDSRCLKGLLCRLDD